MYRDYFFFAGAGFAAGFAAGAAGFAAAFAGSLAGALAPFPLSANYLSNVR
jgi:hypothetical protein